ncbi:MAG: alpha/beta hydrolase [Saprospiraceae bacterium]|nr:alpha/beta hydrolase [Saprospiraceae bacterium]
MSSLKRNRTIRILLPGAYFRFPERRFPVLYMLDGQNIFDSSTSFATPWNLQVRMDKLPYKEHCIIVGIDNGGNLRGSEYLPPHHHKLFHHGEGNKFVDFIIKDLKPKVDDHIRTLPDHNNTIIAGSSMGGLLAFYAATRHGDIFGKAGILSPAFWLYPSVLHFKSKVFSKIYVIGSKTESKGMEKTLSKTYHSLHNSGYPEENIRIIIKDRGKHNEKFWGAQFKHMIKWLMANK